MCAEICERHEPWGATVGLPAVAFDNPLEKAAAHIKQAIDRRFMGGSDS
jgi:hypothetical protein